MKTTTGCCCAFALAVAGRADTSFTAGEWSVGFRPEGQALALTHAGGTALEGRLAFRGPARAPSDDGVDGQPDNDWAFADARDGVTRRLAMVDPQGDVQGYLTFQADGGRIGLLFHHRTALAYHGFARYEGVLKGRADAFACRTMPEGQARVLSLKSGDAVSLHDDSVFSASADEAVRVSAPEKSLARKDAGTFTFVLQGDITAPGEARFSVDVLRDYYKSRWVPHYAPIDRKRCPRPPTGWMSWNVYFDQAGSKENLMEADYGRKFLQPFGLEIWSIESWQGNSDRLPVSRFHNMDLECNEPQFPEGMKWLCEEIKKRGFKPGLWMAPFGTGSTGFYTAHKDWFLHDGAGQPIGCWNGVFTLDPTVKAARDHLRGIFDKAAHEWGYEFFKIDGMSGRGPGYCAHLYELPRIRERFADPACPNPFELCVKAFRDGIGEDRIFLACQGHFTGAEAGYADASRTGADIVHPGQPVKWANIMLQARCTINQVFANNVVFWSDPDCMLVSQEALGIEQARVETTVVSLPGQQMFAGDKLGELSPDRIKLLQQALPVCDVRPADLYPKFGHLPVWDLKIVRPFGDWHVVALFNWKDEPEAVGFDWNEIGEPEGKRFVAWEFWTESWQGEVADSFGMQVPARSVRLVALRPVSDKVQFLSSDRHISQGGVELRDQTWSDGACTATVDVVGGFPLKAFFAVPDGVRVEGVDAPGAVAETCAVASGKALAVTLSCATSQAVPVTIRW